MCPFLEQADARCAEHWSLKNIARAFLCCAGCFADCPVYQQLSAASVVHEQHDDRRHFLAAS